MMAPKADRLARLTALYGADMAEAIVAGRPDRPSLDKALDRVKAGRNPAYSTDPTPGRLAHETPQATEDPLRVAVRHVVEEELARRGL